LTVYTLPSIRGPQAVQWGLVANTQAMSSPFDRTTQTVESPGARWKASVSWPGLPLADWRALAGFLARLGGRAGRFNYGPPQGRRRATATISGTVRVKGAGQTGTSLIIDGLPNSVVVFEAGDWISYLNAASRPMLHMIVTQATSNGSGEATLTIAPPLRGSPADNVEINHAAPVGVFMLLDDEQGASSHDPTRPNRADISIEIIEALV
jgi:hypothetical protein